MARSKNPIDFLLAELESWEAEGMISPDLRALLSERYRDHPHRRGLRRQLTMSEWFLALGGILLTAAFITFLVFQWEHIPSVVRVAIPAGAAVAATWLALAGRRAGNRPLTTGALTAVAAAAIPTTLSIAAHEAGLFDGTERMGAAAVLGTAGVSGLIYVLMAEWLGSKLFRYLYPAVLMVMFHAGLVAVGVVDRAHVPYGLAMLFGVFLCAVGLRVFIKQEHPTELWTALGGLYFTAAPWIWGLEIGHSVWVETLHLASSAVLLGMSVVLQQRVWLVIGGLSLLAYVFTIGFEYFNDQLGWPLVLLVCGAVSMAVGWVLERLRRQYLPAAGTVAGDDEERREPR
ncbi:MAG: DUF2157 domain-containing protein [Phycisphaerales bacterium]|nr:MAG: DUF2157 domain-containing protein [Phycisphaerales bacterium]